MRQLNAPAFAGDDGLAEPSVRRVLSTAVTRPGVPSYLAAVAELCLTRLLVPIVALATEHAADGADQSSEMAVVLLRSAERTALPTFTGLDALQAWDGKARPTPVTIDVAARSAVADGADTLLIDLAGPFPLVIEGEVLEHLAAGHRLLRLDGGGFGWALPRPTADAEM